MPKTFCLLGIAALSACDAVHMHRTDDVETVVEVAIFEGGYGIEWHRRMAAQYSASHPGVRIELWGDPRTADILKPRLLRGDPPDMILDERLPLWLLIAADRLRSFNDALTISPVGGDRPWGESFAPGMLDLFSSEGEVYAIPAAYGAWVCWYDARMFRAHNIDPPSTWDEFLDVCRTFRAAGIAPLAFQGKYPNFYGWNSFVSLLHRVGGLALINRINALEPGAFSHPDAIRSAAILQELSTTHFQQGALAMTHTESQLQFVNGQAAMIFCGLWLENEMKATMPAGFEMRCFDMPTIDRGKGNPKLLHGQGMEFIFVPKAARHPEVAFDFARYLVSPGNAADMARTIGVISPLEGATPREAVTPALASGLDVIDRSIGTFTVRLRLLLPEWTGQVMGAAMAELLRGEISPEAFGLQLDAGVAAARANPDLVIPPYTPYDATAYEEEP